MYLGGTAGTFTDDCVFEAYAQESGRVVAIDFWGYTINSGGDYTSDRTDEVRARLKLDNTGHVTDRNVQFHWTPNIRGTDANKGLNKPTPLP
jgi:hypothetical protein